MWCFELHFFSGDCSFWNIRVPTLVQKLPIRLRRISSGQPGHLLHIRMGYVCWALVAKHPIHSVLRVGVHLPPILSVKRAHIIFWFSLPRPLVLFSCSDRKVVVFRSASFLFVTFLDLRVYDGLCDVSSYDWKVCSRTKGCPCEIVHHEQSSNEIRILQLKHTSFSRSKLLQWRWTRSCTLENVPVSFSKKKKHALFLIDDYYIKHKILLSNSNR
jgi:hypothetical protein